MFAKICRENIAALILAYAKATGSKPTAVSREFYGRSAFLDDLKKGNQSVSIDKLDTVIERFRREWPDGTEWPALRAIVFSRKGT